MNVTIPCPCPPKADGTARHDSDTVTLRAVLDFPTAVLLKKVIQAKIVETAGKTTLEASEVLALMTQFYVETCIDAWTLVDDKDKPVPVTRAEIRNRLEPHFAAAMAVADAADEVYAEVALPLAKSAFVPFQATPTEQSTSAKTSGSPKPPKRSKPSSITSIQTVVTGATSSLPDGVSNTLPSSASAA